MCFDKFSHNIRGYLNESIERRGTYFPCNNLYAIPYLIFSNIGQEFMTFRREIHSVDSFTIAADTEAFFEICFVAVSCVVSNFKSIIIK